MLDALIPACLEFKSTLKNGASVNDSLSRAASKAEEVKYGISNSIKYLQGARSTEQIAAKKGRASYLGDRSIGTRDPGAAAVAILMKAISDSFEL